MKLFNFKTIRMKILFGFSLVILFVIAFGIYNVNVINKSNEEARNIVENELPLLMANERMASTMANRISAARAYVLYGGEYKERFDEYTEEGRFNEAIVRSITTSEKFDELINNTVEWRQYVSKEVFEEYEKGNVELARQNLAKTDADVREITIGYEELASESREMINAAQNEIIANGKSTLTISIALTILIIIVSITTAIITSNIISKPIIKVMERMKLIAQGDLSNDSLETKSQDEVGQLVVATNDMSNNIRELLREINEASGLITSQSEELTQSANEVNIGSNHINAAMQELAAGTESESHAASELASTMGVFSSTVQEANANGERIEKATTEVLHMTSEGSRLMESSNTQMVKIYDIVQDSVQKVQNLNVRSQEISTLVSVIQEIADQTNLLALNAAIEAARAGEQGKGFAVVADEVKKLAEQVSSSVVDITNIITGIQTESSLVTKSLQDGYNEVQQGASQIKTTQETFDKITKSVTDMSNSIKTVAKSLSDIANNSETMNNSISEIAAISEETAAGVEQTSASSQQISNSMEEVTNNSEQLAQLAEKLNELVLKFKL